MTGQRVAAPVEEDQTQCSFYIREEALGSDGRWDALGWSPVETSQFQQNDPILGQIIEWKRNSLQKSKCFRLATGHRALKQYLKLYDELHLVNNVLIRELKLGNGCIVSQVVVPWRTRSHILRFLHDGNNNDVHMKHDELFHLVQSWFFWIGYRNYVWRWVNKCYKCSRERRNAHKRHKPVQGDAEDSEGTGSAISPPDAERRPDISNSQAAGTHVCKAVNDRVYSSKDSAYWQEEAARWLRFSV